ncbi:RNA polymerase sigma factor [Micromonospora sp. U56]|uniref:RNA polymerase sigma factor n=1 Tax=Micromonospora sp. U56 TaxID=2824900 RepID=UPI001B398179|nr:RNA polymerase sigma factor [Micromonospora sp. U56]MBQ0892866.1 RNA polymerase sigma factor [Micromonospora sp. U56]
MTDDRELWTRSLDGDTTAFGTLFERHADAVFGYCLRRTGVWSAAEDLVSVVFLEAWRRRRAMVPYGATVLPWLYGIALGVSRNHHRSLRRHRAALDRVPPPEPAADHADAVVERVDAERRVAAVHRHLAGLARRDREVVEACVWLGQTQAQAAVTLGIPLGTVKSRLARAHRQLRTGVLADLEMEDQPDGPQSAPPASAAPARRTGPRTP